MSKRLASKVISLNTGRRTSSKNPRILKPIRAAASGAPRPRKTQSQRRRLSPNTNPEKLSQLLAVTTVHAVVVASDD